MKICSLLCSVGCGIIALTTAMAEDASGTSSEKTSLASSATSPDVLIGLVSRVTPEYAGRVSFLVDEARETPVISAKGEGGILITAANVRECARAYGYYLRNMAHVHLSWNGDNRTAAQFVTPQKPVEVPATLPMNFAFNYCALSYTGVHWSRERWLNEIDRLALNGFRYVLVTSGLEKVWQGFLNDIGATSSISSFIANPCYAAWWDMGNLEGEGGPVSAGLIESEAELGRSIVTRLRELGMEPVLQGYVGFVPHDYSQYQKDILPQGRWVDEYDRPSVIRPDSSAFAELAKVWYKNLESVYGIKASAFVGDLFHEGGSTDGADLEKCAKGVQTAMQKASPGSIWFIQAWAGNPKAELLKGTDLEHTVILALEKKLSESNELSRNYQGRPYVWCELANFGGNQGLFGGFGILEKASGNAGGASGFGLLSEGLETNPIYYELFFERLNNREVIDREEFLKRTVLSRYGSTDPDLVRALSLLARSVYSPDGMREGCPESILCARPSLDVNKVSTWSNPNVFYDPNDVREAGRLMLTAAKKDGKLMQSNAFRYDLADVCRQVLADKARELLPQCKAAVYNSKDFLEKSAEFMALFPLTADILATHECFLLGTFLDGAAKREAGTEGEMTRNLRRLITTWTPGITPLSDYAHRQLSELIRYYYMPRWSAFFRANGTDVKGEHTREIIVTNNGERIVSRISDNKEVESVELAFPTAPIPLLHKPTGDLLLLAEQALQ